MAGKTIKKQKRLISFFPQKILLLSHNCYDAQYVLYTRKMLINPTDSTYPKSIPFDVNNFVLVSIFLTSTYFMPGSTAPGVGFDISFCSRGRDSTFIFYFIVIFHSNKLFNFVYSVSLQCRAAGVNISFNEYA